MKRLFEMKLKFPDATHRNIESAHHTICSIYCSYGSAMMPHSIGLYPGRPGPSGTEEFDEDLSLLEAMRELIDQSITNHKYIKSGIHPYDCVQDSPDFDGCDGLYGPGLFERPKEWPKNP